MEAELPPLPPRGLRVKAVPRERDYGRHRRSGDAHSPRRAAIVVATVLLVAAAVGVSIAAVTASSSRHAPPRSHPAGSVASSSASETTALTRSPLLFHSSAVALPQSAPGTTKAPTASRRVPVPPRLTVAASGLPQSAPGRTKAPTTSRRVPVPPRPTATLAASGTKGHLVLTVRIIGTAARVVIVAHERDRHGAHTATSTRAIHATAVVVLPLNVGSGAVSAYVVITGFPATTITTRTIYLEV